MNEDEITNNINNMIEQVLSYINEVSSDGDTALFRYYQVLAIIILDGAYNIEHGSDDPLYNDPLMILSEFIYFFLKKLYHSMSIDEDNPEYIFIILKELTANVIYYLSEDLHNESSENIKFVSALLLMDSMLSEKLTLEKVTEEVTQFSERLIVSYYNALNEDQ